MIYNSEKKVPDVMKQSWFIFLAQGVRNMFVCVPVYYAPVGMQ